MSIHTLTTARQRGKIAPIRFAHAVLQTNKLSRMLEWYQTVLEAEVQFKNEMLAFLTYDEEHHRLALVARPGTIDRVPNAADLAHLAYAYRRPERTGGDLRAIKGGRDRPGADDQPRADHLHVLRRPRRQSGRTAGR